MNDSYIATDFVGGALRRARCLGIRHTAHLPITSGLFVNGDIKWLDLI